MSDKYLKDPRANTFEGWIAAFQIFAKYQPEGLQSNLDTASEHDILYLCTKPEPIGKDEEGEYMFAAEHEQDAEELDQLGFHWDSQGDCWSKFT